ncbi:MAG TPA: hypothetical protein VJ761_17240 [Ktedonobacteraceae bacterium]|nr:hypothetical protein [Ktedonobacteraceae bacterium]
MSSTLELFPHLQEGWRTLRGRTYDLLDVLKQEDVEKKLPFPTSQSLYYQLECMIGTTETLAEAIKTGQPQQWHCSLWSFPSHASSRVPLATIREHFQRSDEFFLATLAEAEVLTKQEDHTSPLQKYWALVQHESHHQGQLINFLYALDLPIPQSWADLWKLTR